MADPQTGKENDAAARMRPLFVLSLWRSGSSLLHALLNQHSQIALLYEGELPQLQLLLWAHLRDGSWRERWEFYNQGPSRHGIALESMPPEVSDVWQATRIVHREFARRKQAMIWGEKSPHWYDNALQMARRFPDAQFIFLWRDVNAILRSIQRAASGERFFRRPGFTTRVLLGTEKLRSACDTLRAQGRSVFELDYEELTSRPVDAMQQVCKFLNVPFEDQVTSLQGADRSATFAGEHHSMVRGDKILVATRNTATLTPAVRAKVARYVRRWRIASGGTWPSYPSKLGEDIQSPGVLELCRDRVAYRALVSWDNAVKLAYGIAPLTFAQSIRSWLRQRIHAKAWAGVSQ